MEAICHKICIITYIFNDYLLMVECYQGNLLLSYPGAELKQQQNAIVSDAFSSSQLELSLFPSSQLELSLFSLLAEYKMKQDKVDAFYSKGELG